jgi:hypothetical protein
MKLLLLLLLTAEPAQYVPKTRHLTIPECSADMDRVNKVDCANLYGEDLDLAHPERRTERLKKLAECPAEMHEIHLHFCRRYGGAEVPEPCRKGFHSDMTKDTTLDGLPMGYAICVQDGAKP